MRTLKRASLIFPAVIAVSLLPFLQPFDLLQPRATPEPTAILAEQVSVALPAVDWDPNRSGITRSALLHTERPERPRFETMPYTIQKGDTAWSIAEKFELSIESILWGNENLSADAGSLPVGRTIHILPVDGVLHVAREGDTLERLEILHGVTASEIIAFPGNEFLIEETAPLTPGQKIIVPGGRNPVVWQEPGPQIIPGQGRKSPGLYSGPLVNLGTGYFTWPVYPIIITQPYWGGHPAIDVGTYVGQPIFASDSGTVIFSGWSESGYGNLVIVDHGNGYWTYYGHNSANLVSVGQGVVQGQQVAESGSTGRSTGPHIDFRIRVAGGAFLNPADFLP